MRQTGSMRFSARTVGPRVIDAAVAAWNVSTTNFDYGDGTIPVR
jgi:hypothetical protein